VGEKREVMDVVMFVVLSLVGGLIVTRVLSGLLFWVTKKWWAPSTARTVGVHLFSLAIALSVYTLNSGQYVAEALFFYGLPQLVWFVADTFKPQVFAGQKSGS